MALCRFNNPHPYVASTPLGPKSVAVVNRAFFVPAGLFRNCGYLSCYSATAPVTIGAEKDVPVACMYPPSGQNAAAASTSTPGAIIQWYLLA